MINTCKKWHKENQKCRTSQEKENVLWVIKHACRTLVKSGHSETFPLLGYTENPEVTLSDIKLLTKDVVIGESLAFDFILSSSAKETQTMVIDFVIHFMKANGKQSPKVFKLKNVTLKANEEIVLKKNHSFKLISTRKYHTGLHGIDILVNGKIYATQSFQLSH